MNKIVLLTTAKTCAVVIFCAIYGLGLFAFAFPAKMGDTFDAMGAKGLGAQYYGVVADRKPTTENLFYAFVKSVEAKNNKLIKKYGAKFYGNVSAEEQLRVFTTVNERMLEKTEWQYDIGDFLMRSYNEARKA